MKRLANVIRSGIRMLTGSWVSIFGSTLVLVSGIFILVGALSEILEESTNPYQSLITFTMLPAILVLGILLIVVGIIRHRRSKTQQVNLVMDLGIPRHRNLLLFFIVTATISFVILGIGTFKAYEYTESVAFCGTVCHDVMKPEFTAHSVGYHARVRCADCHIGSGAPWFVRSKISGLNQLLAVVVGEYSRPISAPVHNLRPARDTCEQCHWPEVFHGKKLLTWSRIGEEGSIADPIASAVILDIGGYNKRTQRNVGIHWHISKDNRVEYQPTDPTRAKIKRVRVFRGDGTYTEFENKKMPEPPAGTPFRVMDCIDCHNRPAHRFKDPNDGLDDLLLSGQIDGSIEGTREAIIEAITKDYKTQDAGELGIRTAMHDLYAENAKGRKDINPEQSIQAAVKLYRGNVYPEMKIGWNNYVDHLGHTKSPGCFRCHDEELESEKGDVISQDCELCHEVLAEEEALSTLDPKTKAYFNQR